MRVRVRNIFNEEEILTENTLHTNRLKINIIIILEGN